MIKINVQDIEGKIKERLDDIAKRINSKKLSRISKREDLDDVILKLINNNYLGVVMEDFVSDLSEEDSSRILGFLYKHQGTYGTLRDGIKSNEFIKHLKRDYVKRHAYGAIVKSMLMGYFVGGIDSVKKIVDILDQQPIINIRKHIWGLRTIESLSILALHSSDEKDTKDKIREIATYYLNTPSISEKI